MRKTSPDLSPPLPCSSFDNDTRFSVLLRRRANNESRLVSAIFHPVPPGLSCQRILAAAARRRRQILINDTRHDGPRASKRMIGPLFRLCRGFRCHPSFPRQRGCRRRSRTLYGIRRCRDTSASRLHKRPLL